MDSTSSHLPSPSLAWSHLASSHVGEGPSGGPVAAKPIRREDEAAQLRARLLKLIERNELGRKAAAAEAQHPH